MVEANSKGGFRPIIRNGGRILVFVSILLWLYQNNFQPVNYLIALVVIIRIFILILSKTALFTKKEFDREKPSFIRKVKLFSTLLAFSVVFILLSASLYLNFSDQVGGDPGSYDSLHYKDDKFHNLETTSVGSGSFFETLAKYMVEDGTRSPNIPLPTQEFREISLEYEEISITWFGHSSILIHSNNVSILTDPVFGIDNIDPLFLGPSPFVYENTYEIEDLPPIDYVFISHDHYDHLDMDSVKALQHSTFFVPLGVKSHLVAWDVSESNIQEFDWYEEANVSDILNIAFTPSQHFSGRGISGDNTLWGSWVINLHGQAIFFSGDSGYSEEFVTIGEKYGPFDIAFLEAGQYNEAWAKIHMFPKESIQAAIDLNASTMLPIHNAKYVLSLHPWNEPLEEVTLEGQRVNQSVSTPMIGESFVLGQSKPQTYWWRDVNQASPPFLKDNYLVGLVVPVILIAGLAIIYQTRISRSKVDNQNELLKLEPS